MSTSEVAMSRAPAATSPAHVVLDATAVESYVRDAKLTLVNAVAYLLLVAAFGGLRVVRTVPYLRAAVGLAAAVAVLAVVAKLRVVAGRRALLYVAGAGAGTGVSVAVLLYLVHVNRGTIFAEAVAALVGTVVTHVLDRVSLARGA